MRKTPFLIGFLGILCVATVAQAFPGGKSIETPEIRVEILEAAPPMARVRVIENIPSVIDVSHVAARVEEVPPATPLLSIVDQPDIEEGDRLFLDRVLKALPALCRNNIENIVVRYDPKAERGQATATTMLLRGPMHSLSEEKKAEMIGVITHECGHIISLNALRGMKADGESPFPDGSVPTYNGPAAAFYAISWENSTTMRQGMHDADFVSGYAKDNPFEDIAEAITYFILQENSFRMRAAENAVLQEKLQWVETFIADADFTPAVSSTWNGKIPWDTTKLQHQFSAE